MVCWRGERIDEAFPKDVDRGELTSVGAGVELGESVIRPKPRSFRVDSEPTSVPEPDEFDDDVWRNEYA